MSRRITNLQIRAARALLGWSQARLAEESGISVITVKRLESSDDDLFGARYETVVKVLDALESAGIDFLPQAGGYSHGVQLRRSPEAP